MKIDIKALSLPRCGVCGKVFTTSHELNKHMGEHRRKLALRGLEPKFLYNREKGTTKFIGIGAIDLF